MPPLLIDKGRKRREIAEAAMNVFAEKGFDAASVRQVAREAGVGKGTVYEYFSSKEELIAVSIQTWMEGMIMQAESLVGEIQDPEEKLRTYVRAFVETFLENDQVPVITLSVLQFFLTRLHDTVVGEILRGMFSTGVDSITSILTEGVERGFFRVKEPGEARIAAVNLVAFLDGICIDYLVTGRSFDLRLQVDHYMRYLLEDTLK